jgi:uncharacterized protein YgfB (UPF0149 family)
MVIINNIGPLAPVVNHFHIAKLVIKWTVPSHQGLLSAQPINYGEPTQVILQMSISNDSQDSLYQQLAAQLVSQDILVSPAETHGVVLGMMSVKPQVLQADEVLATIMQLNEEEEVSDEKSFLQFLVAMVEQAREMLFSQGFDVQLLLPQDNNNLEEQTLALSHWCRGYVFGLVAAGLRDFKTLPKDATEIIQDVLQISEMSADIDEQGNEEEKAFFELEQFVRVGVQLVFEELNPPTTPPNDKE